MADIGCDHGKLTAVLAASGRYPKVIGADLRPGPLAKAEQTLEYAGCKDRAELRLGDGLSVLSAGEVGSIVLAGVSAQTTWEILEKAPWVFTVGGPRIIMIPATRHDALRRWFADRHAVLLAGPGLGESAADVCKALLGRNAPWAGAVLDADGLNAAADLLQAGKTLHPKGELILTPHPGEMARLTGHSAAEINADREGMALRYAKAWNAVVVLKGAHTVIAGPDGRCAVNPTGNPGLSRGGSGDVLAGMTSALLACGLPAFDAAACAVYLHGAAADRAAALHGETGMLPHDLLDALGTLFAENGR